MNKKLIAAAIAAAMAAPAAYADATVYGQLKMWVASTDTGEAMDSNGSRIGFKGSEDLGNGMKALFKLEYALDMDNGAGLGATSRSQYVGFAGNFGTVMFGKRETNYLLSTVALDVFGDTLADYNNMIGLDEAGNAGNSRPNNAIHYVSPSFSGVTVSAAAYGHTETVGNTELGSTWDAAVVYSNGGIHASIAHADGDTAGDATRVGLGYKMDAFTVAAVWEKDDEVTVSNDRWMINGTYTMGNNTIKAMWGTTENGTSADQDSWAIGVDHKLSKRTKVYALYADSERDLNIDGDSATTIANSGFALGMQHNF